MVFKREYIHFVASQPHTGTSDTWMDWSTFMRNSLPHHLHDKGIKLDLWEQMECFSLLNHPLCVANLPAVVFILSLVAPHGLAHAVCFDRFSIALHISVVAVNCLLVAHLLAPRMRLAILCWPLSSATHFLQGLQQTWTCLVYHNFKKTSDSAV